MAAERISVRARCPECGRTFGLPSARPRRCPGCAALLVPMVAAPLATGRGRDAGNGEDAAGEAPERRRRRAAAATLRLARTTYGALATIGAILALAWFVLLYERSTRGWVGTGTPPFASLAVGACLALESAALLGARQYARRSFGAWTAGLAGLYGIMTLALLAVAVFPSPVREVVSGLRAFFWLALVALAWRARRDRRWILERGERRGRRHAEAALPERRRRLSPLAGGVALGALAAAVGLAVAGRAPVFANELESFMRAWNDRGAEAVVAFAPDEGRASMGRALASDVRLRGWLEYTPKLLEHAAPETLDDGRVRVCFSMGGGELTTHWSLRGRRWWLERCELPLADLAERFRGAWNLSRIDELGPFFEDAERGLDDVHTWMTFRQWRSLPAIESYSIELADPESARLSCSTHLGPMEVALRFREHRWRVRRVVPPPG